MIKYIVIGDTAVLTTRDLVPLGENITIQVYGIPTTNKASIEIINTDNSNEKKAFEIVEKSGVKEVTFKKADFAFFDTNRIVIRWWLPKASEDDEVIVHIAEGNEIAKVKIGEAAGLLPRISARAVEIENMWRFVANAFSALLPVIDRIENGNDVV